VARKKQQPVEAEVARTIGRLLRGVRRAAGYHAVHEAASRPGCPAALQTIYAYERGGLVPSLKQFLDLIEFYVLRTPEVSAQARYEAAAAVTAALSLPAYHVSEALDLIVRLHPATGGDDNGRAGAGRW
jgi:hypothetical protein